ncbi:hypothetical protein Q4511_11660 [Paracoccus sp. 1_MG-2023]|uniref:hypothetical protein n=1 Tax=unclassified Paracoccus (in: a-proteobacteria) TaxID=2688777 RepID=UPI001C0A03E4|nr:MULTISPECIES: hypothetical protein [unclassified Paracoccus (in: a-proteobacteria)]MBU2957087.1 hypothetical protein [Paracoccus sp. C2R09]MDO6669579.1 hypothetical protein [Paracoccus sp. 1_MG-2023]
MANQNDSFIDEVTDELRRDRLYGAFRRFGWIGAVVILAIVGGASWREYSNSRDRASAQAFGDAVLAAEDGGAAGIADVDPQGSSVRAALTELLAAGAYMAEGDDAASVAALSEAAEIAPEGDVLRELAQLKRVIAAGSAMDASERDQILTRLSRAGAPFELLALEQKAVALIDAGRREDAITLIRQIQQKNGLSQALRNRLSEMMIALGADPAPNGDMASGG